MSNLLRGFFTNHELARCLWDSTWLLPDLISSHVTVDLQGQGQLPKSFAVAIQRLRWQLRFNPQQVWLERHVNSGMTKSVINVSANQTVVLLSLDKFRGGRTKLGDFLGYLNPGEILQHSAKEREELACQVEAVSQGQRLVLHLLGPSIGDKKIR